MNNSSSESKKIEKSSTVSDQERLDYGEEIMSWNVPEYEKHDRDVIWYILAGIISFFMLIYAFWTNNFLFAVIVVIALFIVILHHEGDIMSVEFKITTDGVLVGSRFVDYKEIKNFSLVYQPKNDIRKLYFDFKSIFKYRLSIPISQEDPLIIRENLLKYLPEDTEREEEPISENISRFLKL